MPEPVSSKERKIATTSFGSATPYEVLAPVIGFPQDVRRLTIIDVGSGASSAVVELRRRGARGFGVDPGYRDVRRLIKSTEEYIRTNARVNPFAANLRRAALQAFKGDHQRNRERYKPAFAGNMPFEDSSADIVYSLLCLTYFLSEDRDVFFGAVDEGLRVLKPIGDEPKERRSMVLHPWLGGRSAIWNDTKIQNALSLVESLRERGIPYFVESVSGGSPRLRIVKP
jgi:hypothetical protein